MDTTTTVDNFTCDLYNNLCTDITFVNVIYKTYLYDNRDTYK